jgi:hypothetical protein
MSDPRRLLDDASGLSDRKLSALRAGTRMAPPLGLREAVWGGLGVVATSSLAGAGILKLFVIGAIGGAVVVTATQVARHPAETPRVLAVPTRSIPVPVAPTLAGPPEPLPLPSLEAAPAHRASPSAELDTTPLPAVEPAPMVTASAAPLLPEPEVDLVRRARTALKAGDPQTALGDLTRARAAYPSGVLAQEREVLTIEALVAVGETARAVPRALALLKADPQSPFAARVANAISRDGGAPGRTLERVKEIAP